jgi:hypothetical protein
MWRMFGVCPASSTVMAPSDQGVGEEKALFAACLILELLLNHEDGGDIFLCDAADYTLIHFRTRVYGIRESVVKRVPQS